MITNSQVTYVNETPSAPNWRVADDSAIGR